MCEINAHRGTFFSLGHIFLEAIIDCCDRKRGKERRGRERERDKKKRKKFSRRSVGADAAATSRTRKPQGPKVRRTPPSTREREATHNKSLLFSCEDKKVRNSSFCFYPRKLWFLSLIYIYNRPPSCLLEHLFLLQASSSSSNSRRSISIWRLLFISLLFLPACFDIFDSLAHHHSFHDSFLETQGF